MLGAGGGVGLAAVQLGVQLGATVTAVASSAEKLAVAALHGATTLIDYRDARPAAGAEGHAAQRRATWSSTRSGGDLAEPALRCLH